MVVSLEREMPNGQRNLVESNFEEGDYERGICMLNELLMEDVRPPQNLIRQLIYLSLYPHSAGKIGVDTANKARLPASPNKRDQQMKRMQKKALLPDAKATEASRSALQTMSNSKLSPESLMRAIPCYPLTDTEWSEAPRPIPQAVFWEHSNATLEEQDSFLGEKAEMAFRLCRDCWELLQPDVVTNLDPKDEDWVGEDGIVEAGSESVLLGRHSWFLLEWLIRLFERDQLLCESEEEAWSSLLCSQIKSTHSSGGDLRLGVDHIVSIAFLCIEHTDLPKRSLGTKLLQLLVALTKAKSFASGQLFTSIISNLQSSSDGAMASLLSSLEGMPRIRAFRLALCDRYLSTAQFGSTQARIVPRARPVIRRNEGERSKSPESRGQPYPWALPSSQRMMQALTHASQTRPSMKELHAIFHLIMDFESMRVAERINDATIGVDTWTDALIKGELVSKVSQIFTGSQGEAETHGMSDILLSVLEQERAKAQSSE